LPTGKTFDTFDFNAVPVVSKAQVMVLAAGRTEPESSIRPVICRWNMTDAWSPLVLAGLGAFHGLNPAMGWLFAVALGLHRRSRAVVFLSLVPITVGHAVSIAAAASLLVVAGVVVPPNVTRIAAGRPGSRARLSATTMPDQVADRPSHRPCREPRGFERRR
jgi:hypothetical protein